MSVASSYPERVQPSLRSVYIVSFLDRLTRTHLKNASMGFEAAIFAGNEQSNDPSAETKATQITAGEVGCQSANGLLSALRPNHIGCDYLAGMLR
jgi:hypothetical protein